MSEQTTLIAKNSGVSIGLGITLATFIFLGGLYLGQVTTGLHNHILSPAHKGADIRYIPRKELEGKILSLKEDISELKEGQKEIKNLLNN